MLDDPAFDAANQSAVTFSPVVRDSLREHSATLAQPRPVTLASRVASARSRPSGCPRRAIGRSETEWSCAVCLNGHPIATASWIVQVVRH
jgi:hypothetical protein